MISSQESDLCPPEEMQFLLADQEVNHLVQTVDWSSVPIPDNVLNPTGELPSSNEWQGEHFFDASVDLSGTHKKQYVLSTKLNKLYVDLGRIVPFQIKWDGTDGLFVRALMMFTEADNLKLPVRRCITHRDKDNPTNAKYEHIEHVLASENENANYFVDCHSQRRSVVVPLHLQQGADYALINLKFMCKTSCTGGLNRAQTDVIFTLEDSKGTVLGRQKIGVKICACPKRDKEKEEQNHLEQNGKRKFKVKKEDNQAKEESQSLPVPTKKIKSEFDPNHQSYSFMVTAVNPQVAELAKAMILKWSDVMSLTWAPPGTIPSPVIEITDDVATIPPPYL